MTINNITTNGVVRWEYPKASTTPPATVHTVPQRNGDRLALEAIREELRDLEVWIVGVQDPAALLNEYRETIDAIDFALEEAGI